MSLSNSFSPETHVLKIFDEGGEAAVRNMIIGCAEIKEAWWLQDISAGVQPEDFLRAQALVTVGLRFLFLQGHQGLEPTEAQLEEIQDDLAKNMRRIMRGIPLI